MAQRNIVFVIIMLCVMKVTAATGDKVRTLILVDDSGKPIESAILVYEDATFVPDISMKSAVMDQVNRQFVPDVLLVHAGAQVSFPNSDDIRHHVYSLSRAKRFELKLYSGSNAPPVSFDTAGIVVLGCNIHDNMKGFIYVVDGQGAVQSDSNGRAEIPAHIANVTLWHPRLSEIVTTHQTVSVDMSQDEQIVTVKLSVETPEEAPERPVFGRGKLKHH